MNSVLIDYYIGRRYIRYNNIKHIIWNGNGGDT